MRSREEIADHYEATKAEDLFGFSGEILVPYVDVDRIKPYLKEGVEPSEWEPLPLTEDDVLEEMRHYMEFAWGKVLGHRGISASRSTEKMSAWLFVLGDDELRAYVDNPRNYPQYGAPALLAICEKYGFPVPSGEEIQRMARGEKCGPWCEDGCER